jgi:hypothetical protein
MSVMQEVSKHVAVPTLDPDALKKEIVMLGERRESLLPGETVLREWIDRRAENLKIVANSYHLSTREGRSLPVLDPVVLDWRHARRPHRVPVPKLALVPVMESDTMLFRTDGQQTGPAIKGYHYRDVNEALHNWRRRDDRSRVGLEWKFNGTIPNEERELITREAGNYEQIFLLADAPPESWKWVIGDKIERPKVARWDPIILGYHSGVFVVLGQFDPTPLELYVAAEFTHRQLGA